MYYNLDMSQLWYEQEYLKKIEWSQAAQYEVFF